MTKWQKSGGPTSDGTERPSVRQILREARPESRRLVRQIYREKLEDGVRSRIARMQRDRSTPWGVSEQSSEEGRASW